MDFGSSRHLRQEFIYNNFKSSPSDLKKRINNITLIYKSN